MQDLFRCFYELVSFLKIHINSYSCIFYKNKLYSKLKKNIFLFQRNIRNYEIKKLFRTPDYY